MAKVMYSDQLPHGGSAGSHYDESLWLYNAMDNCITYEVHEALAPLDDGGFAYDMSRMMQAPALAMMMRGMRVDFVARDEVIGELEQEQARYANYLYRLASEGLGLSLNHRSPAQLKSLFYEVLRVPPIYRYDKKKRERVLTTNREALEKLATIQRSRPFAILLLALRDVERKLTVLRTGIDPDGRLRCSYHVVGTETGRWSSSENAFYRGTNLQNITDLIRRIIVPDPGKKFAQFDLKQAESVVVGAVSGDEEYQRLCESGDPHTGVVEMCWPTLGWQNANSKKARRAIAEQKFYRHYTYRDLAKRGGHGSNYGGTPHVLAINLKIEVKVADDFQRRYFGRFKKIRAWHQRVAQKLAIDRTIVTAFGRRRFFTGRPTDSTTLKEAIAYEPQSVIGDYLNQAMFVVWEKLELLSSRIELVCQVHDSLMFQFDPTVEDEAALIAEVQSLMALPITINGKQFVIGTDAVTGWNWGKYKEEKDENGNIVVVNPYGLREFEGHDDRDPPPQG